MTTSATYSVTHSSPRTPSLFPAIQELETQHDCRLLLWIMSQSHHTKPPRSVRGSPAPTMPPEPESPGELLPCCCPVLSVCDSGSKPVGHDPFGKPLSPKTFALLFIAVAELRLQNNSRSNFMVGGAGGGSHHIRNCIKGL